jgi:hypothetical protein
MKGIIEITELVAEERRESGMGWAMDTLAQDLEEYIGANGSDLGDVEFKLKSGEAAVTLADLATLLTLLSYIAATGDVPEIPGLSAKLWPDSATWVRRDGALRVLNFSRQSMETYSQAGDDTPVMVVRYPAKRAATSLAGELRVWARGGQ